MNWLKHKWNVIMNSRTSLLVLVLLFFLPISFCVFTITNEYQAISNLSIEIIDIELENGLTNNNSVLIKFRISNPTYYNTPQFTMDIFIRPIVFSSDRFVAESKISEIYISCN